MESRDRRPLLAVAILWIVHTVGLVLILADPTSLFDARPFLDQDWGLHHTHLISAEAFWNQNAQLWGYSPNYMAGYPSNTHLDASIKAFELAALFTPGVSTLQAFKAWVFLATSSIPLLCLLALQNFVGGRGRGRLGWPAALATALVTASWWSSFGREMYFYGMVGWPVGCALALLVLSLFYRLLESERGDFKIRAAWLFSCALLLSVHCQASIMLPLPGLVMLLAHRRRGDSVAWGWAVGGAGFALLVNAVWLVPLFDHFGDEYAGRVVATLPVFVSLDGWTFFKDYLTDNNYWSFRETGAGKLLRIGLLFMGTAGLVRLFRDRRLPLAAGLATLVSSLFLLTYFGSLEGRIQLLQPLRFKVPLDMTLAVCAAFGLEDFRSTSTRWRVAMIGALLLAVIGSGVSVWKTETSGRMRIQSELLPPVAALVDWLRAEAPRDGRVLFEESGDETGFVYGGVYLSSFVPSWTGHQLIGGPTNLYADRHAFAELHSGRLFGRDPRSYSDDELLRYLRLYNIGTVVAFHPVTIRRFSQLDGLIVPIRSFGGRIAVFSVDQPLDWFLEGEGRVEARLGELHCTDVRASEQTNAVVLKYHWIEGMRSEPPLVLEPVLREADPIPFIRIMNPPASFKLTVGA